MACSQWIAVPVENWGRRTGTEPPARLGTQVVSAGPCRVGPAVRMVRPSRSPAGRSLGLRWLFTGTPRRETNPRQPQCVGPDVVRISLSCQMELFSVIS